MLSLSRYIAENNTQGAIEILNAYGVTAYANDTIPQLEQKLKWVFANHREEAIYDFAKKHPDFDLIATYLKQSGSTSKSFSNACGCSGFQGTSNCDGCGGKCGGKSSFDADDDNSIQQFRVLGFDGEKAVLQKLSLPANSLAAQPLNKANMEVAQAPHHNVATPYLLLGAMAVVLFVVAYK